MISIVSDEIAFTKVKLPFGWLGNMAPYYVIYEGDLWRTTEALFQAMRFRDASIRQLIRDERSPMGAKFVARSRINLMDVEPRSAVDLDNMRACLRLKVDQHPILGLELMRTGQRKIIEDETRRRYRSDLFWGAAREADGTWTGRNELGKMWMDLRSELEK